MLAGTVLAGTAPALCLPALRRRFALPGSRPSARKATFTPAPVNPSDRAVGAVALSDAVLVSARPSGASRLSFAGGQAPGMVCSGSEATRARLRPGRATSATVAGPGMVNLASGITRATAGSAARRRASSAETVAAMELTSVNGLILVACTACSSPSSDPWAALAAAAAGARAPSAWLLSSTITGSSTSCDSRAVSAGVNGPKAGPPPAARPDAAASVTATAAVLTLPGSPPRMTDASTGTAMTGTATTDKDVRFGMLSSSRKEGRPEQPRP